MKRHLTRLACLLLLVLPAPARALVTAEGEHLQLELTGSARLFPLFQRFYETELEPAHTDALSVQRVRTEVRVWAWDSLELHVAYDLVGVIGTLQTSTFGEGLTLSSNPVLRIDDLESVIDDSANHELRQNLDRLNLTVRLPFANVVLGRQAIGHGSGRILAPSDIFGAFSPASVDNEYKPGIDAARISVPLGTLELEAIGVGHHDDMADGIYVLRGRGIFPGFDVSAYAGSSYQIPTVALDVATDAGGTGLYLDTLMRFPEDETGNFRSTAGLQHRFDYGLSAIAELHYNSLGATETDDYLGVTTRPELARGEMFLLGAFYGAINLTYEASPLVSVNVLWLQNLIDGSALFSPSLSWDFQENVAVGLGALIGVGERPSFSGGLPQLNSELGAAPAVYFGEIRIYY